MLPADRRIHRLVHLAGRLQDCAELTEATEVAVKWVSGLLGDASVSVVMSHRHRPRPVAANDPQLAAADHLQAQTRQGPAVDVLAGATSVQADDLAIRSPWPLWGPQAAKLGWRGVLATRLVSRRHNTLGVLEFATARPDVFTPEHREAAREIAGHLSVVLDAARIRENLSVAQDAQLRVGQAIGLLMERHNLDADQAFAILRRYSQDGHRKLRDVADELLATRDLPAWTIHTTRSGWTE